MNLDFPLRKDFDDGRFAYVAPLTFGKYRINVTSIGNEYGVEDLF